ncbi:MAG: STN domain-containing protein, partial [Planctomycetaceae bacterium]
MVALTGAEPKAVELDRPVPDLHVAGPFERALERPLFGAWDNIELRRLLGDISRQRQVAVLLDRRIDPAQPVDLDAGNEPLRDVLDQIAELANAEVRIVGQTVFITPPETAAKARTLVQLRSDERPGDGAASRRQTVHWNDLDTPADVLRPIADKFGLTVN